MEAQEFKMIYYRISNVIHTDPGLLQGFTFKKFHLYLFFFRKFFSISIPFWILSYNKKQAQEIDQLYHKIKEMEQNGELD